MKTIIIKMIYKITFFPLLFFSLVPPLLFRINHIGVWCLFGITATVGINGYFYYHPHAVTPPLVAVIKKYSRWLLLLIITFEIVFSSFMIKSAYFTQPNNKDETAIVLGCLVIEDKPSLMLKNRLEKSLAYLELNPDAKVIVTGGTGMGSSYSEAEVEKNWLVNKGISPNRIILEDQSHDTFTNIQNAKKLISEHDLPTDVVLFTDGFHQLRSQLFATEMGLTPKSVSAATPWGLFPTYWVREQLAIIEAIMIVLL